MPRTSAVPLLICLCAPLLAGCIDSFSNLDFDLRPDNISSRPNGEAAPRPAPDANGLISYESYQVVIARRGDTVADVANRIGLPPTELAQFNGRTSAEVLRADEVLALPRRVVPATGSRDIASIASGAIDAADARTPRAGAGTASIQPGQEPARHRVTRGETAFSVARLYGVSVRDLAEWNGLGPDLSVREGQFLIIPVVLGSAAASPVASVPGSSIAPLPPSAATPLPDAIEQATLPQSGTVPAPSLPDPTPEPAPPPVAEAPAPTPEPAAPPANAGNARFITPVSGNVIRPFGNGNEGIDYGAATGTAVLAAGDGEVAAITRDTDQIPILVLRHPDGLLTVYANIRNITVSRGDQVAQGDTLAEVGPGEPSFLHFEVRRGFEAVNPNTFLP